MKNTMFQGVIGTLFFAVGLYIHEFIQIRVEPRYFIDNALERAVPFWPWTIWIYFSFFPFIASTAFRVERDAFWRFLVACTIGAVIGWSLVILIPITFVRPDPGSMESTLYSSIFAFVHKADPSHITFPSLHVTITWICCLMLRHRRGRWLRIGLGVGISLSTLLVKQHLVSDVVGGVALAWGCVWITERRFLLRALRGNDCSS